MKLCWATDWDIKGNGYGYTNHTKQMKKAIQENGVVLSNNADIALHICTPPSFEPIKDKINILFTMYECAQIPPQWIPHINQCDILLVPCNHNKMLFSQYTKKPIYVCQEGIDNNLFPFVERRFPEDRPFTFLWIGASNPRKGWEHVGIAWEQFFKNHYNIAKNCTMIMKTTQITRAERKVNLKNCNLTIDTRDYSMENLFLLYSFAHCFIFPTMGEGWGLTLHEAQATGLPCIYTAWSGVNDFMKKEYAFPLKFRMKEINTVKTNEDGTQEKYFSATAASADIDDIVKKMLLVYNNYDYALKKAKKASEHVSKFTWFEAGKRLLDILIDIESKYLKAVA